MNRISTRHTTQRRDEAGVIIVTMALSLLVLIGFAALAVDLGYLHMKRGELQTAADAGALAGAAQLVSAGEEVSLARDAAVTYARQNLTAIDMPELAVGDTDAALLRDGTPNAIDPNQVEVSVGRTTQRNNPVDLFFGQVLGVMTADVGAMARASVLSVCSSQCVKPFIVPTKFEYDDTCEDPSDKAYDNGEMDVDSACELSSVNVLGYHDEDHGAQVTLKIGNPADTVANSHYSAIDLPPVNKGVPVTGGDAFRENIAGCTGSNTINLEPNDEMALEPGNMVGPTKQGLDDLLDEDPGAYWDSSANAVRGSIFDDPLASPRVAIISFYDPREPLVSGRTTLKVYQLGAVFIEGINPDGSILGRFMIAMARSPEPGSEGDCMLRTVRLTPDTNMLAQQ